QRPDEPDPQPDGGAVPGGVAAEEIGSNRVSRDGRGEPDRDRDPTGPGRWPRWELFESRTGTAPGQRLGQRAGEVPWYGRARHGRAWLGRAGLGRADGSRLRVGRRVR